MIFHCSGQGFLTWTQPCGMQCAGAGIDIQSQCHWSLAGELTYLLPIFKTLFQSECATCIHGKAFKFLAGLVLERVSKAPNFQQIIVYVVC